jgi:DNA mismatch endonuclease, patch repair protein
MADVLTPEQRRLNMSRIRGKDTRIELVLRSVLHAKGLRYRLHRKDLPGRPDLVFARYRTALFIHGCFWHGHGCHLSKMPETRKEFWAAKIAGNMLRDARAVAALREQGWRVAIIWECAIRGPGRKTADDLAGDVLSFLNNDSCDLIETVALII